MCNDNCPFFNYPTEACPVPCPYDGPDDDLRPSDEELIGEEYFADIVAFYADCFDDDDY